MNVSEAINHRNSIRAFKSTPVPQSIIKQILTGAVYAPSWANTQPWEFAVAAGRPLEEIKAQCLAKFKISPQGPEIPFPPYFSEKYISRIKVLDKQNMLNTEADWKVRRVRNFELFGAPAIIYILAGRDIYQSPKGTNAWMLYDCGAVAQNIMLLALEHGLGTITISYSVVYPDILRKVMEIPESQLIVMGIAIGYPDAGHPLNQFRTEREPVDKITRWYGF